MSTLLILKKKKPFSEGTALEECNIENKWVVR